MGSVNLNSLKNVNKSDKGYTFTDLHLDIEEIKVCTGEGEKILRKSDIRVDYDELAIKNSLINIFNTIPGERFLLPEFGTNLLQFLFRPVTESTARAIGNSILNTIERWEPRVIVDNVNVIGRPTIDVTPKNRGIASVIPPKQAVGEHEYAVTVIVTIPELRVQTKLGGVLTQGGFAETQLA